MQSILDRLTAINCQQHQLPLERICIEVNCQHPSRGMCRRCPRTNQTNVVNIQNLFDYLEEQGEFIQQEIYKAQAMLFQQFIRQRIILEECLDQLQITLLSQITNISDYLSEQLNEITFANRNSNHEAIQALGELFSQTIGIMDDDSLYFKSEVVNLQCQNQETSVVQLMQELEGSVIQFNEQYNATQVSQQSGYKLSQTLQLSKYCDWICFNHDETQIAAVDSSRITLFSKSQEGLWIQCGQRLMGYNGLIQQVQFNHNSTQIVACGRDNLIVIWSKQCNGKWEIHVDLSRNYYPPETINSICFNHNSTILAHACRHMIYIDVLNIDQWQFKQELVVHQDVINQLSFNHDSTLLASGSDDNSIILWKYNRGGNFSVYQILSQHTSTVETLSFNMDSTLLVSGSSDETIKIWSVEQNNKWKCIHTLIGHSKLISSVQFNEQSNMIVSGSWDKLIKVWRINNNNRWECTQTINANQVDRAIISSDSQTIIAALYGQRVHVYSM